MIKSNIRILHITEALGGGVLNVIAQLAEAQSADGHEVCIAHSVRLDTPGDEQLAKLFPSPISRITLPMATEISLLQDVRALAIIVRVIDKLKPDIIHLHSSKAGVLGRIASLFTGRRASFFYTPHGFSFLRQDITTTKRKIFKLVEKLSSYCGGTIIACSRSEHANAVAVAGGKKVRLVENSIPLAMIKLSTGSKGTSCTIATSGRLCPQKNPAGFRTLAVALADQRARFVWIGGGELEAELWVDGKFPDNLTCTGWVSRERVVDLIEEADIYVMTSRWEGMPLSLIEAQAAGLPAVVPDVAGCNDVVLDGVTGFICRTDEDMVDNVQRLISDISLRQQMGRAARDSSARRFSPERMHREMIAIYGIGVSSASGD